jgi:hypothetical protein
MMTAGSLPSITATHEFVVPRSIPIIFPIIFFDFIINKLNVQMDAFSNIETRAIAKTGSFYDKMSAKMS